MRWGPTHRHTNTHINPHIHPIQEQTLPVYLQNISRIWTLLTISCTVIQATAFCLDYWYSLLTSFQFLSSAPTCPPNLFSILHSPEGSLKKHKSGPFSIQNSPMALHPTQSKRQILRPATMSYMTWHDYFTGFVFSYNPLCYLYTSPTACLLFSKYQNVAASGPLYLLFFV